MRFSLESCDLQAERCVQASTLTVRVWTAMCLFVARNCWAFVVFEEGGAIVVSAHGVRPPWINDIPVTKFRLSCEPQWLLNRGP